MFWESDNQAQPLKTFKPVISKNNQNTILASKIDSLLEEKHQKTYFQGSVLVSYQNKVLINKHMGLGNLKTKSPITDSSTFQLASVSKQFTAAAILMLCQQNKLSLEDSIQKFFPKFPYKKITIAHLLYHTSGLPLYFWYVDHLWKSPVPPTNSQMIELMSSNPVLSFFEPGKKFEYSNTGYFLLASIVEQVSNMSFAEFLTQNIFEPLNMHQTYVYSYPYDSLKNNQLIGYQINKRGRARPIYPFFNDAIVGDKNVYSTTTDLFQWLFALNNQILFDKTWLPLLFKAGTLENQKKVDYAMGFRLDEQNGEKIIYHNGRWNGFRTSVKMYTETNVWVIILNHTSYSNVSGLADEINQVIKSNSLANELS